jgi:hypothetical protein
MKKISTVLLELLEKSGGDSISLEQLKEYYYSNLGEIFLDQQVFVLNSELKYQDKIQISYRRENNRIVTIYVTN